METVVGVSGSGSLDPRHFHIFLLIDSLFIISLIGYIVQKRLRAEMVLDRNFSDKKRIASRKIWKRFKLLIQKIFLNLWVLLD